jgi:hypothetical protein
LAAIVIPAFSSSDHAVDIGEQTAYLVRGEFEEFTDASHETPRPA